MSTTLTALPSEFSAGSTVVYRRGFSEYPAGVWTLTLYLAGASADSFVSTTDGVIFVVTLPASDTDDLLPGRYQWVERVSKGGEVYDAAAGLVTVTMDLSAASAGSGQTSDERLLALVEAALAGRIPAGMESYQIGTGGGSVVISKIPHLELLELRRKLRQTVAMQRGTLSIGRPILTRFSPEGRGQ